MRAIEERQWQLSPKSPPCLLTQFAWLVARETMVLEIGVYTVIGLIAGFCLGATVHLATFRADTSDPSPAVRMGLGRGFGGGVAGGILIIIVAVVWFTIGYFGAERIYFFPIIMFVLGIVAIVRGIVGSND